MSKISIRFYNNCEVRDVWNEGNSPMAVLDTISNTANHDKTNNYYSFSILGLPFRSG